MSFDYENFCTELTENACKQIPSEINLKDKRYIWNNVYYYSLIAAKNNMQKGWDMNNTSLVSQYVAEWTLNIAVDLHFSDIRKKYQDIILNSISYKAFMVAKSSLENELNTFEINYLLKKHIYDNCKAILDEYYDDGKIPELNYRMAVIQISKYLQDDNEDDEKQNILNKISINEEGRLEYGMKIPKITVREFYWGGILLFGILTMFIHSILILVMKIS